MKTHAQVPVALCAMERIIAPRLAALERAFQANQGTPRAFRPAYRQVNKSDQKYHPPMQQPEKKRQMMLKKNFTSA